MNPRLLPRNFLDRALRVAYRLLRGVLDLPDRPLDLARAFVGLALFLKPLVASQSAHGLFDPTLGLLAEFAHLDPPLI
jgi:hypothetical protein